MRNGTDNNSYWQDFVTKMKLGLLVNPIAGMGGRVGLKGTDNVLSEAIAQGAEAIAPKKAVDFLLKLRYAKGDRAIDILTCPGIMGETEAKAASFPAKLLLMRTKVDTTAEDTKKAAKTMVEAKVDLIVFVGGDGTARDICEAVGGQSVPVLGVPSGVKMYSGIFAVNSSDAVDVVLALTENRAEITDFEIIDADEAKMRQDEFSIRLYGHLKGPLVSNYMLQGSKELSPDTGDEKENQRAIARFIVEQLPPDATLVLGPGTTIETLAETLGISKTLLGVDIYAKGIPTLDVNEKKIIENVADWNNTWIIVSPIGRQGILLGRGNQQITPNIIKQVGKARIVVAATKMKLRDIESHVLRVDTGDEETDKLLRGYIRVYTDYREWRLIQVK